MIQSLQSALIDPPASVDPCPFCGVEMYWLGIVNHSHVEPRFWHPGTMNDAGCVLNGQGFGLASVEDWNKRASEPSKCRMITKSRQRKIAYCAEPFWIASKLSEGSPQ